MSPCAEWAGKGEKEHGPLKTGRVQKAIATPPPPPAPRSRPAPRSAPRTGASRWRAQGRGPDPARHSLPGELGLLALPPVSAGKERACHRWRPRSPDALEPDLHRKTLSHSMFRGQRLGGEGWEEGRRLGRGAIAPAAPEPWRSNIRPSSGAGQPRAAWGRGRGPLTGMTEGDGGRRRRRCSEFRAPSLLCFRVCAPGEPPAGQAPPPAARPRPVPRPRAARPRLAIPPPSGGRGRDARPWWARLRAGLASAACWPFLESLLPFRAVLGAGIRGPLRDQDRPPPVFTQSLW